MDDAVNMNAVALGGPDPDIGDEELPIAADDNIIIFESNTDGYVSWMNGSGGYMIQSFTSAMRSIRQRLPVQTLSLLMEKGVKRKNKEMASVETLVCKQFGIQDLIHFCKPQ